MSRTNAYDFLIKLLLIGDSGEEGGGTCRYWERVFSRQCVYLVTAGWKILTQRACAFSLRGGNWLFPAANILPIHSL